MDSDQYCFDQYDNQYNFEQLGVKTFINFLQILLSL